MNQPQEDEWEWEWKLWMEEMEEHIEFCGEGTMAESVQRVFEFNEGDGYAVDSK